MPTNVPTSAPTFMPTLFPTTPLPSFHPSEAPVSGPICIDFECGEGYSLRENASMRLGNDRATCCFRDGVCAGAPEGNPCSLGDIDSSIIPNPSFEERSRCPQGFGDLAAADSWVQATRGTSDYLVGAPDCSDGYSFVSSFLNVPQGASDGAAFVGVIAAPPYYEYVGACLIRPLSAGVDYTFTLDISSAEKVTGQFGGDTDGVTELFCVPSCDDFQIGTDVYMGDIYDILGSVMPTGGLVGGSDWKSITFEVNSAQDCPAIMFGPGRDQTIESGQSGTYVLYDYLNLQQGAAGVCNAVGECVPVE